MHISGEYRFSERLARGLTWILLASTTAAIVASPAFGQNAAAEPTPADQIALEDIVVTARRVEEQLQTVPVAVTAFSAADLKNYTVQNFGDLQQFTPGLKLQFTANAPNAPHVQLRGQSQSTSQFSVDPPIGVYLDGIYNTQTFGIISQGMVDVERVEVLKGPQGTLYGKNTTGGAVAVYTKLPTDRFEGEFSVGLGDYERRTMSAVVNIPFASTAALRVVGTVAKHSGYGRNSFDGSPLNDQNDRSLRATLKLDPTDRLEIILRGDISRGRRSGTLNQPLFIQPGTPAVLEAALTNFGNLTLVSQAAAVALYNQQIAAGKAEYHTASINNRDESRSRVAGGSATVSYDLGDATLKSITAYRYTRDDRKNDIDASSVLSFQADLFTRIKQFSEELQISGTTLNDRLRYTAGLFYINVKALDYQLYLPFPRLTSNSVNLQLPLVRGRSAAVYGQGTYEALPGFSLTAGLRWTTETKEVDNSQFNAAGCALGLPGGGAADPCTLHAQTTNKNLSYNFVADWLPVDGVMIYAKTSRGFKSGFVNQSVTTNAASQVPVQPEEVTDYEVGIKSQWLENRLRVNAAFYHSDYKNVQRNSVVTVQTPVGPQLARITSNAAAQTIDGIEVEATAVVTRELRLLGTLAYTRPKYKTFIDTGFDQTFQRTLGVSKWTYTLSGSYDRKVDFGRIYGQIDWAWRSSADMSPFDAPGSISNNRPGPGTPDYARIQRSYGLLNMSVGTKLNSYSLDLRFWVKNVLQKDYYTSIVGLVNGGVGTTSGTPGDPRHFGVDLSWQF